MYTAPRTTGRQQTRSILCHHMYNHQLAALLGRTNEAKRRLFVRQTKKQL